MLFSGLYINCKLSEASYAFDGFGEWDAYIELESDMVLSETQSTVVEY
ncbi:hypothetical protein PPW95_25535 (plasmid) [Vibrio parahaemolyticus]|nr:MULTISPECIES: hypothetical protein [Vibrio harveyi group]ARR10490.1 unknow [Vibrio campbellii]WCP78867.1 hypothetical protein PPW95_25535 [Vibrio parahaemolyticus]WHP52938.1 hypothetical protein QMY43_25310 [Vibrio parahaemolyticus]